MIELLQEIVGYSFLPIDFAMLSSSSESNRLVKISHSIGKRTNGYKRRNEAMQKKPRVAIKLIQNALNFKSIKSFMKLGTEFQGRSYDMMISHTTLVYCRYILLEWLKREEHNLKTFRELFRMYCDDIQDMDLTTALQSLMGLFIEHINNGAKPEQKSLASQLQHWIDSQAIFIKGLFKDLKWGS